MLNWIIWNRTIYLYKMDLALDNQQSWYAIKPKQTNKQISLVAQSAGAVEYTHCYSAEG